MGGGLVEGMSPCQDGGAGVRGLGQGDAFRAVVVVLLECRFRLSNWLAAL